MTLNPPRGRGFSDLVLEQGLLHGVHTAAHGIILIKRFVLHYLRGDLFEESRY